MSRIAKRDIANAFEKDLNDIVAACSLEEQIDRLRHLQGQLTLFCGLDLLGFDARMRLHGMAQRAIDALRIRLVPIENAVRTSEEPAYQVLIDGKDCGAVRMSHSGKWEAWSSFGGALMVSPEAGRSSAEAAARDLYPLLERLKAAGEIAQGGDTSEAFGHEVAGSSDAR